MTADEVARAIELFRRDTGSQERTATAPLPLSSWVDDAATDDEINLAWPDVTLPDDVLQLWRVCRRARLLVDVAYGQWGLVLLSPAEAAARTRDQRRLRPDCFDPRDLVLGEFLGDLELLVVSPSEPSARRVLVAWPLDPRECWPAAGATLADVLTRWHGAGGAKYWETQARTGARVLARPIHPIGQSGSRVTQY